MTSEGDALRDEENARSIRKLATSETKNQDSWKVTNIIILATVQHYWKYIFVASYPL